MKHPILLVSTLLFLGLPGAAHALCDRYPNATFTLNMPATITVPDSLPLGGLITRQAFSGSNPAFFTNCTRAVWRWWTGRYPKRETVYGAYPTEIPGVGIRILMTWAGGGGPAGFAIFNQYEQVYRNIPSFTSAEAQFYKIGPVTNGTMPAGRFIEDRFEGGGSNVFLVQLGSPIRFVRPAATCDLAAGDVNRTVSLPPIQASALQGAIYAGAHNFELTANCSDATNVTFSFSGPAAIGNPSLFANTGTAGGIAMWLYSRVNGGIQNLTPGAPGNTRTVAVSGNRAVLPLGAAYHKNGTVRQGTLVSSATVNITYN